MNAKFFNVSIDDKDAISKLASDNECVARFDRKNNCVIEPLINDYPNPSKSEAAHAISGFVFDFLTSDQFDDEFDRPELTI